MKKYGCFKSVGQNLHRLKLGEAVLTFNQVIGECDFFLMILTLTISYHTYNLDVY